MNKDEGGEDQTGTWCSQRTEPQCLVSMTPSMVLINY